MGAAALSAALSAARARVGQGSHAAALVRAAGRAHRRQRRQRRRGAASLLRMPRRSCVPLATAAAAAPGETFWVCVLPREVALAFAAATAALCFSRSAVR